MAELRYVDWDGLVYYDKKIKEFIADRDENYFKMGGECTSENLPSPSFDNLHHVYKITNKFTSNDRFLKPGYVYTEGTWVVVVDKHETYYYDILVEDESARYYTKDEVDAKIPDVSKFITEIPAEFITEDELDARNFLTTTDLDGLATEEFVKDMIADVDVDVDLSAFYTKDEVDAKFEDCATEDELSVLTQAVVEVQASLDEKANIEDIPSIEGLATEDYVDAAIENIEVDLTGYATEEFVRNEIANIPEVDLTDYAKKSDIPTDYLTEVPAEYITETELAAEGFLKAVPDTYATKDYVRTEIAKAELNAGEVTEEELNALLANYYTKEEAYNKSEVDAKIPDVSGFATKTELEAVQNVAGQNSVKLFQIDSDLVDINAKLETIPSIEGLATETYVDEKFAQITIPDVSNFITMSDVEAKGYITLADVPETDLSNYYTKSEVDTKIAEIEHPTVDLEGYATEAWVNEQGFLTEHQDLSEYAKKSEIPEAELFVVDFNAPDFTAATEAYNKGKFLVLTNAAPDGNGYAVMNYVRADMITFTKFLTSRSEAYGAFNTYYLHSDNTWEVSKEVKLNKVEANVSDEATGDLTTIRIGKEVYTVPSIKGLASTDYVDNKFAEVKVPTKTSELENDSNYITAAALDSLATVDYVDDKFDDIVIPDTSKFVTMQDVEAKGYLTEHQDISHLATKDEVSAVENKIPDVSGFATIEALEEAINNIEHPTVDLDGYATENWVLNELAKIDPTIPSEYVTEAELEERVAEFITLEDVDTSDKADLIHTHKLEDITDYVAPDFTGYATEQFVTDAIAGIPATDLSDYYTKAQTDSAISEAVNGIKIPEPDLTPYATIEQLGTKADNVPFTTDMFVTAKLGNFAYGDNLNGLSVTTILTKLLGLQPTIVPDEPDVPEEPKTLVDKIITEEIPMYSVSANGELIPTDFRLIDGNTAPTESGFYVINDESGNRVEAGYQDLQVENDEIYYVIALPKEVDYSTMVAVETYDPDEKIWVDADIALTSDPDAVSVLCEEAGIDITHIDTDKYTVWVQEDICTGSIIRYRIIEEN